jgi:uncharacterized protein YifE (UPF0438 family)
MGLFMAQMLGQPSVALRAVGLGQQPIQPALQPPGGRPQPVQADDALFVAIPQRQRLFEQRLDRQWEARRRRRNHWRHLPTAPHQMRQAALMEGLLETVIAAQAVMDQPAAVLCSH